MSEKKSSGKSIKKRNWAFVLYPESAPADWREKLQLSGLQYAISPLHDKDIDPTGTPKKAHYHVILVYGSPTTYNNVKNLTDSLNQPIPQALEQIRGYYRYLTHKDNPDKHQYADEEIICGGGFDISNFIELSKSEVTEIKFTLQKLIREQNIIEYQEFMDYIQDNYDKTIYDVASSNTIFFNTYIKSRRHSYKSQVEHNPKKLEEKSYTVDKETGEILE